MAGLSRIRGGALKDSDRAAAHRMTDAVLHRGPDETVYNEDRRSCFGFQHLAKLAPADGRQPFVFGNNDVVLMVNGEIYNHRELEQRLAARHRFVTKSGCEVLLHGYLDEGLSFLQRVRGMFAFALLDNRSDTLTFGRDRFGIRPLYFHADAERVVFASEMKALFQHPNTPRKVDWRGALADPALNLDLTLVSGPVNTWFEDISIVPAAHTVSIDLRTGATVTERYWDVRTATDLSGVSADNIITSYRDLLAASVAECLPADAEAGLLLSGGIDSGAVAAFSAGHPVHTFTALAGSTVITGDAEYSHRTAKACGLANYQIMFDKNRVPSPEEWRSLLWLLETPQASPEHFYKYELHRFARATRPGLKAMLLGQASDEFNGGYTSKLAGGRGWDGFMDNLSAMARATYLREHPELRPWFAGGHGSLLRVPALEDTDIYRQYVGWKAHDLEQYNTWHEDRTAAGNSTEVRVPFMDHRLVELTNGVPEHLRPELFWDKTILRRAMKGLLPPDVISRPKASVVYDDDGNNSLRMIVRMLAANNGELLEDALSARGAKEFVNVDAMRAVAAELGADPGLPSMEYFLRVVNLGLLDNLVGDPPKVEFAVGRAPVPEELIVQDWDESVEYIRGRVFADKPVGADTTLHMDRDVRYLTDAHDPAVRYLSVDEVVEYSFTGADAPLWLEVVKSFETAATPAAVAASLGADADAVLKMALTAHRAGLLSVVNAPAES